MKTEFRLHAKIASNPSLQILAFVGQLLTFVLERQRERFCVSVAAARQVFPGGVRRIVPGKGITEKTSLASPLLNIL